MNEIALGFAPDLTDPPAAPRNENEMQQAVARAAFEWRVTFDSIPALILLLDEEGTVLRLNAAALALSDYGDYRSALGRPIHGLGQAAVWSELRDVADTAMSGEPIARSKFRDRAGLHWDVVARAWTLAGRTHCTVVASDVTKVARMEESLQRSERMSAVGTLLANVAHEVRNPLFAISATLDAIDARGPADVTRLMSSLRDQVSRMTELMQDLLEYGRPASEFEWGDLGVVIAGARASVRPLAERSSVAIELRVAAELPSLWMDRRRLVQVFENLLRNSVQHSPPGGTVDVVARLAGNMVEITVTDRGPGFRPEDLHLIFEPFYTRRRGGTGLGLSLAERIVADHNGSIHAANAPEGGAVMTVLLPVDGRENTE
jgi:signal transduction histidine kinase